MYWYYNGIQYDMDDLTPLVDMLKGDPQKVSEFRSSCLGSINGFIGWGDYGSARETFDVMCAVLVRIDELTGHPHITT